MATGFGAGLAGGLQSAMQLGNQKRYYDKLDEDSIRKDKEFEWKQQDRDKEQSAIDKKVSGMNDLFKASYVTFRTDGSGQSMDTAPQQESLVMDPGFKRMPGFASGGLISLKPRGYAEGGVIPDAVFSGNPSAAYQTGGLANPQVAQRAPVAKQQPSDENIDYKQEFTKMMLTSDLLTNPDKLSKLSALAEAHGVGDEIKPFLERAYTAKKSGMIDGAMQLMRGQVDEAIDSLARGGIKLEDRPTPVDPKNPKLWKINISGVGEREMDIGDLLQTTLDPDKFLKHQMDQNESHGKRALSDSAVRENDSKVGVNNAQADYIRGAKTQLTMGKLGGGGSGGGRADRPEKIDAAVKRRDSIIDDLSSTTGDDGKPFVDPKKRMQYSSLAVDVEEAITERMDRDLTAKEHHKLTDLLRTAPLGNAQGMEQWGAQVERTFGGGGKEPSPEKSAQKQAAPVAQPNAAPLGGNAQPQPQAPARAGGLQALKEQQELRNQMNSIQQALKNPNLSTQQKQNLALQANEIQKRTEAYYRGR